MVKTVFEILDEWAVDANVDETNVGPELLKISKLQSKYSIYLANHSLLAKQRLIEYAKMKAIKHDYYTGLMSKEELDDRGWKPYLYSVKNKDAIDRLLEKDDDLNNILLKKALNDEASEQCKNIIKDLHNRGFRLNAWVSHQKYLLGM